MYACNSARLQHGRQAWHRGICHPKGIADNARAPFPFQQVIVTFSSTDDSFMSCCYSYPANGTPHGAWRATASRPLLAAAGLLGI